LPRPLQFSQRDFYARKEFRVFFDFRLPHFRSKPLAGVAVLAAAAGATLAAFHPSAASTILAAVTCATNAACVSGINTTIGPGVSATSAKGTALTASGSFGISATGTGGYGVFGSSTIGEGLLGGSTSAAGVRGYSKTAPGVSGSSSSADGVSGTTSSTSPTAAGVSGSSNATGIDGRGVSGSAISGAGVYGNASCCYGVLGSTSSGTGIGVRGTAGAGYGVYGDSTSGAGVVGSTASGTAMSASAQSGIGLEASSASNAAIDAQTNGVVAIYGKAPNGNGAEISGANIGLVGRSDRIPLYLSNLGGGLVFYVDGVGNVFYNGVLRSFARTVGGATVTAFSTKSTQPTVEDTGTAQLIAGTATIRFDPAFAASIDSAGGYRVFLTPNGETRGSLYVPLKTANGFIVREALGGRSTVSFDYRIVAAALGASAQRMTMTAGALPPGAPSAQVHELPLHAVAAPSPVPLRAVQSRKANP
jgi:hypothetical protein